MEAPASLKSTKSVGPYQLIELLGKSSVGMCWRVKHERLNTESLLYMPRQALPNASLADTWRQSAIRLSRVKHPHLCPIRDANFDGLWPYLVLDPHESVTLNQHINAHHWPDVEHSVDIVSTLLSGLASLHEASLFHHDIDLHSTLIDAKGHVLLIPPVALVHEIGGQDADLTMAGLFLHKLLLHRPAYDEPDLPQAVTLAQTEIIRLPFDTPAPVNEALRAIVNRSTERHISRRFVSARGLIRALEGWKKAEDEQQSGTVSQMLERVRRAGVLPALPGLATRVAKLTSLNASVDDMGVVLTEDPALTFELLRLANAGLHSEEGPVISVRRAIQLLGFNGIQRAANALKPWPGSLQDEHLPLMKKNLQRARRMAFAAAQLAPAGLHEEEPLIVALMQCLGRLITLYHFPEEAIQIQALRDDGMDETAAVCAVLGTDEQTLALALVKQWGWKDEALDMVRPLNTERAITSKIKHMDWLRAMAGAMDGVLRALESPSKDWRIDVHRVAQRYHRFIGATSQELYQCIVAGDERLKAIAQGRSTAPGTAKHSSS